MINLSRTKKVEDDFYFLYKLNKRNRGDFLNTWFEINTKPFPKGKKWLNMIHKGWITLKKVDDYTSARLYHKKYNPIIIRLINNMSNVPPFGFMKNCFCLKVSIKSVDDSSYTIEWYNESSYSMYKKAYEIMQYIQNVNVINGDDLLNECIKLGANAESIHYD
jgi:hypothetical protein